jgi:hypothetical protein
MRRRSSRRRLVGVGGDLALFGWRKRRGRSTLCWLHGRISRSPEWRPRSLTFKALLDQIPKRHLFLQLLRPTSVHLIPDVPNLHPPHHALLPILLLEILHQPLTDALLATTTDTQHHIQTLQNDVSLFLFFGRKRLARSTRGVAFTDPSLEGTELCGGLVDVDVEQVDKRLSV